MDSEPRSKLPKLGMSFCHHCEKFLASKTYKRHKKLFYNEETERWITADEIPILQEKPGGCPLMWSDNETYSIYY